MDVVFVLKSNYCVKQHQKGKSIASNRLIIEITEFK